MINEIDRNVVIIAKNAKPTSRNAAESVYPKTGSIRLAVYEHLLSKGMRGATDQEMQSALHLSGDTLRPTRKSLENDGLVIDSAAVRKNDRGHDCIVWRVVSQGMLL